MMSMEKAIHECDPTNFNTEFEEVLELLYDEFIIDEDEMDEYRDCLYGYLRDYIRFAASERPPDRFVDRLYEKTLDMIDGAIRARDMQADDAREQMQIAEEFLVDCGIEFDDEGNIVDIPEDLDHYCQRWLEDYEVLSHVIESLEDDKEYLEEMKKKCWLADDRLEKIMCIEEFVQATHTRGHYLATGCGLPLPEAVIYEEPPLGLDTLGAVATELTRDVLNCLREFKGEGDTGGLFGV